MSNKWKILVVVIVVVLSTIGMNKVLASVMTDINMFILVSCLFGLLFGTSGGIILSSWMDL